MSNNLARIKATEGTIKRHTTMAQSEDKEMLFEGGTIEISNTDERIRIHFDAIPDTDMRDKLKKSAFKWSPKNQAWQRQLTPNAKYAIERILGIKI